MDEGYFLKALRRQLADLVSEYPQLRGEDRAFSSWVLMNYVGADEAQARADKTAMGPVEARLL